MADFDTNAFAQKYKKTLEARARTKALAGNKVKDSIMPADRRDRSMKGKPVVKQESKLGRKNWLNDKQGN